tara:strand:+ start:13459 stop:13629 length:171 start_codon:yes stop_codon:yes gene_type:complete
MGTIKKKEKLYTYGVEDLQLTKEQKDALTSKWVNIVDSNDNVIGNVEVYIIGPYEE